MRRRQESPLEKLYHYRSVILLVSIPLMLLAIVFTMMPRSDPGLDTSQIPEDPLGRSSQVREKAENTHSGKSTDKYAVIIDCGSTGSRIHVYKFNSKLELQEVGDDLELFIKIKPGLSKYADEPKKGGDSLRGLLDKALEVIPESLQKSTPVRVGATAGLRLLPGDKADKLLAEVRLVLADYPFTFKDDSVKILGGADEGTFAWVTVNYLLGYLGQSGESKSTAGVVDLGGGSVQLTYAVSEEAAKSAPAGYVREVSAMGSKYNVYVHSYLGFGLMAARAALLAKAEGSVGHPCIHKDFKDTYNYAQKTYPAESRPTGSEFKPCAEVAEKALDLTAKCEHDSCSFGGVWSGGGGPGLSKLFVASYFFDRAAELGVIPDPKVSLVDTSAAKFGEAAKLVCESSLQEVSEKFPLLEKKDSGYACLDITYQYLLLTKGFGVDDSQTITLVKQIAYKGKEVEAAWPLGAAIAAMA